MKKKKNNFYLASLFSIIIATVAFAGCARDKQMQADVSFNIKFLDESGNQPTKDLLNLNDELAAPDTKPLEHEPGHTTSTSPNDEGETWLLRPNLDEGSPTIIDKKAIYYRQYHHASFLKSFLNEFSYVIQVFRAEDRDKLQFEDGVFATSEALLTLDPLKLLNQPYKKLKKDLTAEYQSEAEQKIVDACCAIEHDAPTKPIPADQSVALTLPAGGEFFMRVYVYHPAHMYMQGISVLEQSIYLKSLLTDTEYSSPNMKSFKSELERINGESVTFKPVYFANTANFTVDPNTNALNLDLVLEKINIEDFHYTTPSETNNENSIQQAEDLVTLVDARNVGSHYFSVPKAFSPMAQNNHALMVREEFDIKLGTKNKHWPPKVYRSDAPLWHQVFIKIDKNGEQVPFYTKPKQSADAEKGYDCVFDTLYGYLYIRSDAIDTKPNCLNESQSQSQSQSKPLRQLTHNPNGDREILQNELFTGFLLGLGYTEQDILNEVSHREDQQAKDQAKSLIEHLYITTNDADTTDVFNRNLFEENPQYPRVSIHTFFGGKENGKEADIEPYNDKKRVYRERICIEEYYQGPQPAVGQQPAVPEQCFYSQEAYEAEQERQKQQQQQQQQQQ